MTNSMFCHPEYFDKLSIDSTKSLAGRKSEILWLHMVVGLRMTKIQQSDNYNTEAHTFWRRAGWQ